MSRSAGSLIGSLIVGGMFLFVGVMAGQERWHELRRGLDSASWPSVAGEVTRSKLTTRSHGRRDGDSNLFLRYRYRVGDMDYVGERVSFRAVFKSRVVEQYVVGSRVTVFYYPDDPSTAVLEPGVTRAVLVLGLGLAGWGVRQVSRRRA